jgi:polysaccharide chain length determinant protein (PEP-CTERM system associated)
MRLHPEHLIRLLGNEVFVHRKAVVGGFVAISLAMLVVGLVWPKGYTSWTTILVVEKNIIRPLMEGAAVATDVTDRSRLAGDIIFGRRVMSQILEAGGWAAPDLSPEDQEKLIERIAKRTKITNLGKNLIKIEYRDESPERTYKITERYAALFIDESLSAKAEESQKAFEFIDKQVQEYHDKLAQAEQQLKEFRSTHLDARPGSEVDISRRLDAMQTRIEQTTQELNEAEIRKRSLEKQLTGEAETAYAITRESQYRARLAEMQTQLETLRLSYLDTHPDIVRLRHQIADMTEAVEAQKQRRETAKASGIAPQDEVLINNPMYQQLRRELSQTQVTIDTLKTRLADAKRQRDDTIQRGERVHTGEVALTELTRDYQVNRDLYQDLLKRRENARVSMNLDKEKQGLTFKIQEPAVLPLQPTGLGFMHFVLAGLLFGVAAPVGLIYARIQFDPRVRSAHAVAEQHRLPMLAVVPHYWSPAAVHAVRREIGWLVTATTGSLVVIVLVGLLRIVKVL